MELEDLEWRGSVLEGWLGCERLIDVCNTIWRPECGEKQLGGLVVGYFVLPINIFSKMVRLCCPRVYVNDSPSHFEDWVHHSVAFHRFLQLYLDIICLQYNIGPIELEPTDIRPYFQPDLELDLAVPFLTSSSSFSPNQQSFL